MNTANNWKNQALDNAYDFTTYIGDNIDKLSGKPEPLNLSTLEPSQKVGIYLQHRELSSEEVITQKDEKLTAAWLRDTPIPTSSEPTPSSEDFPEGD